MTAMTIGTNGSPFTVDDLEGMPDDGRRYELVDGMLLASPAPGLRHQTIIGELFVILRAACPRALLTLAAPFAVRLSEHTELQPDLLVAKKEDFTEKLLPLPPLLAVEVLSRSTALVDLNVKRLVFERVGVPSYWIIDPAGPTLTVFELGDDGLYQQTAEVKGEEVFETAKPFAVRFSPAELLGPLNE